MIGIWILGFSLSGQAVDFYVGASGGTTYLDFDDEEFSESGATFDYDTDREDKGFKVFVGANLSKHFGLEASYIDLGEYQSNGSVSVGGSVVGAGDATAELRGGSLHAVLGTDHSKALRLFGKVGASWLEDEIKSETTVVGPSGPVTFKESEHDDGLGFTAGIGLSSTLSETIRIRAEAEYFDVEEDLYFFSLGIEFSTP